MEVYIRAVLKGDKDDGARVVSESDYARKLKKEKPQLAPYYTQAISNVVGLYKNLSERNTPKLDYYAQKMVNQQTAKLKVQKEQLLQQSQVITRRHVLTR